jgi:D-alanyl-D-alanine dipeptidase
MYYFSSTKNLHIALLGLMVALMFFSAPLAVIQAQSPAPTDKPTTTDNATEEEDTAVAPAPAGKAELSIKEFLCTPDITLYNCINRLYRFGIVAGFFIAVLMIVVAGYMYMTGGEKGKEKGKSYISSTFVAITILLTSYLLLNQINPELTKFKKIQPLNVNPEDLGSIEQPSDVPVFDGGGNPGGTTPPGGSGGGSDNGGTTPPGGGDTGGGTPGGTNGNPPINTSRPPSGMVEVNSSTHPGIVLNMKYASTDNFTGARLYTDAKCYLTSTASNKLKTAQAELQKQGKSLEIYDCYRPTAVQTLMNDWAGGATTWAGVQPTQQKSYYVPKYIAASTGGAHPAGRAIDLTIQGLSMPSRFDEFSASSQCSVRNGNCFLLKTIMSEAGFSPYTNEWCRFC